jgi:hypothetical protein
VSRAGPCSERLRERPGADDGDHCRVGLGVEPHDRRRGAVARTAGTRRRTVSLSPSCKNAQPVDVVAAAGAGAEGAMLRVHGMSDRASSVNHRANSI